MAKLADWSPYQNYVQGGMRDGDFSNGQFVLICAGPPHMSNFRGPSALGRGDVVFPIGLTQNIALSHNRAISRIFEIGSERSYFIPGRTVGQVTLSRVYYHGASLLRALWAYYEDMGNFPEVQSLFNNQANTASSLFPWAEGPAVGGTPATTGQLHDIKIPPGFENLMLNLASDLFSQPIGLLLVVRDSEEQNLGAVYLEQCYVPTHTWATDSQGLIIQESVGIQFERLVPVNTNSVALVRGLSSGPLPDSQTVSAL